MRIKELIAQIANTDVTVLFRVKVALAKSSYVRFIRALPQRQAFVKVNCAALPSNCSKANFRI
jgi:transcriptional regulator with GAF, ATPase, and Fis domain